MSNGGEVTNFTCFKPCENPVFIGYIHLLKLMTKSGLTFD